MKIFYFLKLLFIFTIGLIHNFICFSKLGLADESSAPLILEIKLKGDLSKDLWGTRPIVWGQLKNRQLVVNGEYFKDFDSKTQTNTGLTSSESINSKAQSEDAESKKLPSDSQDIAPSLTTLLRPDEVNHCERSRRVKDLIFLMQALEADLDKVQIEYHEHSRECSKRLRRELSLGVKVDLVKVEKSNFSGLKIGIVFKNHKSGGKSHKNLDSSAPKNPVSLSESQKSVPLVDSKNSEVSLRYLGKKIEVVGDGFFVVDVNPREDAKIDVLVGDQVVRAIVVRPFFAKLEEPKTSGLSEFQWIVVSENAPKNTIQLRKATPEDPFWRLLSLSIPIYIEGSLGYTLLDPVPSENQRDRPTMAGQITTQPLYQDWFLAFVGTVSVKPQSTIPVATVGQVFIKKMFDLSRENLQLPLGFGLRTFKAKVEKKAIQTETGVIIPEAVLGPDMHAGLRMRWSRTYFQYLLGLTPLKIGKSPWLYDMNTSLSFGFRWRPDTSFTWTTAYQGVSFPTNSGVVRISLSSVLIGIHHDME